MVISDSYKKILAPVNGSAGDARLIKLLSRVCETREPRITLVYVVEVAQAMPLDADLPADIERGEQVLAAAEQKLRSLIGERNRQGILTELLQARSAGAAIVDEATEQHVDAILMATETRVSHGKVTIGDSVSYVLKNAPCEVMVVRLAQDGYEEE